jgi:hypothetical protein
MSQKIIVDLPHKLGAEEARRRIARGVGRIGEFVPGGAEAESHWTGDRLDLRVTARGQGVSAAIDVQESIVRVEMDLPGALAFFAKPVEAFLRRKGTELLEGRRSA